MGNGISSRRSGRVEQNPGNQIPAPAGYPAAHSPPSGYVPFLYPAEYSGRAPPQTRLEFYPHNHILNNGQMLMSMPPGGLSVVPPLPPPPNVAVHQRASTIRNHVNLKKTTLRLEKDEENPGFYLVAFSFDATVPGSICIFFLAKEGHDCSLTSLKPHLHKPIQVSFAPGLGQSFRQEPGTGVQLSLFEQEDLVKEGPGEVFPLVVRTQTIPKKPPPDAQVREDGLIGAALPKWVHAQTTHAVLEVKDGEYRAKVLKQIIWVDGVRYELQEIYGIENNDGGDEFDNSDSGKECVICMSELRDTTVLPCRHMCMCSACAKVLRFQTTRCPICRTPVEKLLEIKVPKTEGGEQGDKGDIAS